jgi:hypothetical protein
MVVAVAEGIYAYFACRFFNQPWKNVKAQPLIPIFITSLATSSLLFAGVILAWYVNLDMNGEGIITWPLGTMLVIFSVWAAFVTGRSQKRLKKAKSRAWWDRGHVVWTAWSVTAAMLLAYWISNYVSHLGY